MYPIDFTTCTARDVILRSLACHPSLFADALANLAETHRVYARDHANSPGAAGARAAHRAAMDAIALLNRGTDDSVADALVRDTGPKVQAYTVAASLNLVPHSLRADIMGRA